MGACLGGVWVLGCCVRALRCCSLVLALLALLLLLRCTVVLRWALLGGWARNGVGKVFADGRRGKAADRRGRQGRISDDEMLLGRGLRAAAAGGAPRRVGWWGVSQRGDAFACVLRGSRVAHVCLWVHVSVHRAEAASRRALNEL